MKCKSISLIIVVCLAVLSFAGDFGITVSNTTVCRYTADWNIGQTDRALLWISLPLSSNSNFYVSGFYEFAGNFSAASSASIPYRFDVGPTYFSYKPALSNSILTFMIGRLETADAAASIYSGTYDGLSLNILTGNSRFDLQVGYLGLLYKYEALILIDDDDIISFTNDTQYFASPRLLAMFGYSVNDFLNGVDIGFEFWSQFDLDAAGTPTHTLYYEPRCAWRISNYFTLSGFGSISMLFNPKIALGYAYGAEFSASIPSFLRSTLSIKLFTSGGTTGDFVSYAPIRLSSVSLYASGIYSDATALSAKFSLAPLATMIFAIHGDILFREGTVIPAGYAQNSESSVIGTEYGMQLVWQVVSDVVLLAGVGVFLPNTLGAYPADAPNEWQALLRCVFNF